MLELHRNVFYNIITSGKRWVKTTYTHTHTPMQTQVISKTTNDRSSPIRRSFFSPLFAATSTFLVLFPSPSVVSVGRIGRDGGRQTSVRGRPPRRGPHQLYPPSRELFRFCCGRCRRKQWEGAAREKRVRQVQALSCRKGCMPGLMPLVED